MDAGYGNDTGLRTQVTALDLSYVAGIGANTGAWPPGTGQRTCHRCPDRAADGRPS